jgi:hypothetical protein
MSNGALWVTEQFPYSSTSDKCKSFYSFSPSCLNVQVAFNNSLAVQQIAYSFTEKTVKGMFFLRFTYLSQFRRLISCGRVLGTL